LKLVGTHEIFRRHAEARRRHLLDRAVTFRAEARTLLSALAGVAATTKAIHRDRERLVRLTTDRPERHRPGDEAFDDGGRGFNLVERHGVAWAEVEQTAECPGPNGVLVRQEVEFAVGRRCVVGMGWRKRRNRI